MNDLTGHVTFGPDKPNVIAVRADNSAQPASRLYTDSGTITVIASAENLANGSVTLIAQPPKKK